jgi:hypothetical protein
MGTEVLLIATRYDTATYYIHDWAVQLRNDLLSSNAVSSCMMLEGHSLCFSGQTLTDAIERADFVVFYGHGEVDHWISMPQGSATSGVRLVEVNSVSDLRGRQIYAACCHSLKDLGQEFANVFPKTNNKPEFVGYSDAFDFSIPQREEFRRIVHYSVRDFILGKKDAATIASEQEAAWRQLDAAFSKGGMYNTLPDAIFAASNARSNALAIGHK